MLDLDRLRSFVCFSELLSFTRAAKALGLSQPALHAQVAKLADELGVVLYLRQGRQLVLTEQGEQTAAFGREILERIAIFGASIRGEMPQAAITLAAGEGSYLNLLGPAIRAFIRQSSTPLRLITANREETIEAVRLGRAHVGVTVGAVPDEDLVQHKLARVGQVLVVPSRHLLANKKTVRLGDLSGEALIVPPRDRPHRRAIEDALANIPWEVAVEASGWELMLHFARLGLGLTIVNGSCRIPRGLVGRPLPELPRRDYFVFMRRMRTLTGSVAQLVATLRDHCSG